MPKRTPTHPKGIEMSTGTTGFKEATEALFEGDAETAAQRLSAATAEVLATQPTINPDEIIRQATANALRELEGRPAVKKLFVDYPEIKADEDLQLLADRRVDLYERQGISRAEAIRLAGEDVAEKFKLGKHKEPASPASPRAASAELDPEVAEASRVIAEIANARAAPATLQGPQEGARDPLAAEQRRALAWRRLRGGDY